MAQVLALGARDKTLRKQAQDFQDSSSELGIRELEVITLTSSRCIVSGGLLFAVWWCVLSDVSIEEEFSKSTRSALCTAVRNQLAEHPLQSRPDSQFDNSGQTSHCTSITSH